MATATEYESDGDVIMQGTHQPVFGGERPEVAKRPVKLSSEPKLLGVLCLYELQKPVDDVGMNELRPLTSQRVHSLKNAQVPDLEALFKKHSNIDTQEDDMDARRMKLRCDFPIDNLKPAILRDEARHHTRYVDQGAKRNDFVL
ncbi:uncharacterized protein PITG_10776 [Phytophthora infestans T30-4]|uniref:Uncharacterized protein n=1 Tax=Phytophthora infestans (strain T30-4) TaxID=403677 RepID=D0NH23_PHYIT|nr:uncharacterized protein PITG_10776 [Phytophthora infestans T30-4]EEY58662.1 conserved hypothetical protein [Phytophthora infestans T30-4]|eukprot:XP_002901606.1 conserved hypothetical protein [Phytophthora infestans T30-4]